MTARIFIGCSANNEDLEFEAILEYTLRKYASIPLDINWMKLSRDPKSFWYSDPENGKGWNTKTWATPFSPFRWAVPAACNFEGKAIYLDIDMIVRADIAQLWNQEFKNGAVVIAKGKGKAFCCSMFDCEKIKLHLPPIEALRADPKVYRDVRKTFDASPFLVQPFEGNWNCIDGEDYKDLNDPDIKIIHCSWIPSQPHRKFADVRLRRQGKIHWDVRPAQRHKRPEIDAMMPGLLGDAAAAGFPVEKYWSQETFGAYGR